MQIDKLRVGYLRTNCYFITNENNDLIIVDPGDEFEQIKSKIGSYNLKAVFVTHKHPDHIGALRQLLNYLPVPTNPESLPAFDYQIILTPGHTEDSISFFFPIKNVIFTGDFLFSNTIGRTDLPGGNNEEMKKSLYMIKKYNDEVIIYPGHGRQGVLKEEKSRFDTYIAAL